MTKKNKDKLVVLVFAAMLAAIAIVLSRVGSINIGNTIRIGFGRLPVFLASLWFGPAVGLVVGAVADIIGALIFTGWNPVITIPAALAGFLPAIFARLLRMSPDASGKGRVTLFLKVSAVICTVHLLTSGVLMTVILNIFYPSQSEGLLTLMATRCLIATAEAVVSSIIIYIIYSNRFLAAQISKYSHITR